MIAALVPNNVFMTSSLDCSYSFHYFCLLMSKKNHCHYIITTYTFINIIFSPECFMFKNNINLTINIVYVFLFGTVMRIKKHKIYILSNTPSTIQ